MSYTEVVVVFWWGLQVAGAQAVIRAAEDLCMQADRVGVQVRTPPPAYACSVFVVVAWSHISSLLVRHLYFQCFSDIGVKSATLWQCI